MPALFFLDKESLGEFLSGLLDRTLLATVEKENDLTYSAIASSDAAKSVNLHLSRSYESIRPFFMPALERVSVYGDTEVQFRPQVASEAPLALVGIRDCDLEAIKILDQVIGSGDFTDPFYTVRRKSAFLVSCDCVAINPACFCNLVGGKPYPDTGFDLNLTPLEDGYVVEAGSEDGASYLKARQSLLCDARPEHLERRQALRQKTVASLREQNACFEVADGYLEKLSSIEKAKLWGKFSSNCVECAACTSVCPTCHCFFLFDQIADAKPGTFERLKAWDSCLSGDYARMAGVGGLKPNPRPRLQDRFRNRFLHKYVYFYQNFHRLGCTGCGRCIESCLGGSDLRKVLKELVS